LHHIDCRGVMTAYILDIATPLTMVLAETTGQVRQLFEGEIVAVLGGTHLVSADDDMLAQAVDALREEYGSPELYVNHCTGQKATASLAAAFGSRVQPCPAGTVLTF